MGEPKRIAVTQIGTVKPVEKKDKRQLCHRFTLSLVRSTEKTCPEFSYTDLLKNTVDAEQDVSGDESDPFSQKDKEEHDRLQALAQSLEEKYAPVKQKPKKKCSRIQEFVDLGDGYDDADPFIDNTEAYDELVPSCLTTQHGGFYINSGKLDFRAVSDSEDDFQSKGKKKFTKKNIITSDNESESLPKKRGPKKKFKDEDDIRKKKRKKLSSDSMDKPILKRKKFERDGFRGIKLKKKRLNNYAELLNMTTSSSNNTPGNVINGSHTEMTTDQKDGMRVSAAALQNVESAIDSVISQSRNMCDSSSDEDSQETSLKPHSSQGLCEEEKTKLPENLPPPIPELIAKLKQAVCDSEMGKKKFFTPKVNQMLLQIENGSRQLPAGIRTAVYSHLAAYLPCSKETLIKRAKKLQLQQNDDKLREPIAKLKEVINKSMPALVERHQAELQAVQQMKRERKLELRENGSTESDEEADKPDTDKQKRIMAPRRKFEWTPDVRNLLHQIVQIKLNHYELSKIRSQTPEDYLKSFFEQELKPLWPQGWMQSRLLFKESRAVHQCWTNPSFKPRRSLTSSTGISSLATVNGKSSTPVSLSTVLPSQANNMSVSSGANTSLVPSVCKTSGSLPSSGESSDTSCSDGSSPSTQQSTLAYEGTERSSAGSVESLFQPVAGSQAISSTSKLYQTDVTTASNMSQHQASIKQSLLAGKDLPRDSLTIPKSTTSVGTLHGSMADAGITTRPEASCLGGKTGMKPHLSAALQDMFYSTAVSSAQKSTHHSSHSFKAKSQDSLASLKDTPQSHNTATNQGYKQTSTASGNNNASSLSSITSNKCQVKLSDVLASNQKFQQNYQDICQGTRPAVTSQEPQMTSSSQVKIFSDSRSQKKTATITSQSSVPRISGQSGSMGGKKFQISPTDMSIIRAGLAQAATQMVLKAQEKQISSSGPKHTSPEQQVNQTAVKSTSSVGPQVDLSGMKRVSPVSKDNNLMQQSQKQAPAASQSRQSSPAMHMPSSMQSLEKSKKAVTSSAPYASFAVSRGHSVQEKLSPVAHSTVAESGLFAIPGMPVTTSARNVAVNQVSSTSGIGNNRSSAHSSAQALNKAGINVHMTSQSQSIHSASAGSESQRHTVHSQLPSSQLSDIHSPVFQTSSSQRTSFVHTATVTRPTSSAVSGTQHSLSVSLSTSRQPSNQPSNSHVTSSSHGTANRTSPSSLATKHGTPSSQAAPNRIPSTGQHGTTRKPQQSNITSNNVVQATSSNRMQQPQITATGRVHLSQTAYGQQSSLSTHVQHSQSTASSHVQHMSSSTVGSHSQQSQPISSICNLASNRPLASYNQMMSLHSRPDSTSSAAKNTEPKFGGLTLSQIQAQTLKASQKAHIQTAQQYNSQPASTSPTYRSTEGSSVYGVTQLRSPGQTSHSFPGYSNTSPSSHNPHQSPEANNSGSNPYSILRTPPSLGHHNTSPAQRSSQNRY